MITTVAGTDVSDRHPAHEQEAPADMADAFAAIAGALSAETDLDGLMRLLVERISLMLGVSRCALYLRDQESDLFRGHTAHPPRRGADEWMSRSVAGIEADRFTQEILGTKKPVLITNARDDPRPMHGAMLEWGIQAMLGVPMILDDEVVGLLFLDNGNEPHAYTEAAQLLAAALANLSAVAIAQARRNAEMRDALQTAVRQNRLLRQASVMDDRLSRQVLDGADLDDIAASIFTMTEHPCAIYDASFQELAVGVGPDEESTAPRLMQGAIRVSPEVSAALADLQPGQPKVVGPFLSRGLQRRHLVARVEGVGDASGYVVLMDHRRSFSAFDSMVVRRAATIVALMLSAERRAIDADSHARESLVRDLVHGFDEPDSLRHRAGFHQLALDRPHVVGLLRPRDADSGPGTAPTVADVRAASREAGQLDREPFCAADEQGVTLLVPLPDDVCSRTGVGVAKDILEAIVRRIAPDGGVLAAVSPVCRDIGDYQRAFAECHQVIRCMTSLLADETVTVLASDDLGAGRLLLSSTTPEVAERFAVDAAGALLEPGHDRAQLLATLAAFCDSNRNVRATGLSLGIHENTVRYRLGKIAELTGLELTGNTEDQLTAQFVVLVFKLRGWLGPARATVDDAVLAHADIDDRPLLAPPSGGPAGVGVSGVGDLDIGPMAGVEVAAAPSR